MKAKTRKKIRVNAYLTETVLPMRNQGTLVYLTQKEKLAVYILITKAVGLVSNMCVMKDPIKRGRIK